MPKCSFTYILLLISFQCLSQKDSNQIVSGIVPKVDILLPVIGFNTNSTDIGVSLEKELAKHESIELTYQSLFNRYKAGALAPSSVDLHESQVLPEFRYYFSRTKNHAGFYAGIYPEYVDRDIVRYLAYPNTEIEKKSEIAMGIDVGFKFYIYKNFMIEALVGDAMAVYTFSNPDGITDNFGRLTIDIGYRF